MTPTARSALHPWRESPRSKCAQWRAYNDWMEHSRRRSHHIDGRHPGSCQVLFDVIARNILTGALI